MCIVANVYANVYKLVCKCHAGKNVALCVCVCVYVYMCLLGLVSISF